MRLRHALGELDACRRRNESLFANTERDLPLILEQLGGVPSARRTLEHDHPGPTASRAAGRSVIGTLTAAANRPAAAVSAQTRLYEPVKSKT